MKNNWNHHIKNERGQASLVLSLAFAAVSAILVIQMSSAYQFVNSQHNREKSYLAQQELLQELALQVKQAYDIAQMREAKYRENLDKTDNDWKCGAKRKKVSVPGAPSAFLCVPNDDSLCVKDVASQKNAKPQKHCLSFKRAAVKLPERDAGSSQGAKRGSEKSVKNAFSKFKTKVRIRVPKSNDSLNRKCGGEHNPCLQLSLCPPGQTSCGAKDIVATQIVRLGALNNEKLQEEIAEQKKDKKNREAASLEKGKTSEKQMKKNYKKSKKKKRNY